MPRGIPRPLPIILRIEGLSDGRPIGEQPMVDDFGTGEVIESKVPQAQAGELPGAQEIINAGHRAKAEHARRMLEVLMPQVVDWTPEPKAATTEQAKSLTLGGQGIAVRREGKPWRRV